MKNVTPFLWFNNNAERAIKFYLSVFKNSKLTYENRQGKKLFSGSILLNGQELHFMNGGPAYKLTPAFSLFISCKNQKEVDYYWNKLSKGGTPMQCGWVTDLYGLTWQVVPEVLGRYLADRDPKKSGRVMDVMLKMKKLDCAALKKAYEGKN
jgi:predicted 3-demethylubiquinone-9 3-methyltransferase (glyoxalase superfamily)